MNIKKHGALSSHTDSINKLFFIIMSAGFLCFIVSLFITRGQSFYEVLFAGEDMFMDLFNSISHSTGKIPYENMPFSPANGPAIYPPFAYLIYKCIAHVIPRDILLSGSFAVRSTQIGFVVSALYITVLSMALYFIIAHNKKGTSVEKFVFSLLIAFSFPFIFQLERANIIFISLIFLMLFIYGKESENKIIRELSLICLAVSTAIKIYPAIFGLLLVKEKRYKETLRLLIYGIVCFFAPFFAIGGVKAALLFFKSLSEFSVNAARGFGYKINFTNAVKLPFFLLTGESPASIDLAAKILLICLSALAVVSVFTLTSKWKAVTLLSLLMILIPSFSYMYTLIFLLPPLMLFLDAKEDRKAIDYVYAVLFCLMFIPIAVKRPDSFQGVSMSVFIENFSILILFVMLIGEGMVALTALLRKRFNGAGKAVLNA